MNRIKELENQIRHHNDLYWNGKETEISDIEYDNLCRELEELDPDNQLLQSFGKADQNSSEKLQPKYDGMSGLLENGTLSSRGDGEYGQDYTDKLKLIEFDTNKKINPSKDYLLGEIIIKNS